LGTGGEAPAGSLRGSAEGNAGLGVSRWATDGGSATGPYARTQAEEEKKEAKDFFSGYDGDYGN